MADLAGVSTATAARALGGYGSVSPEVRDRVAAAAAKLKYRRNSLARSMITGNTHTIGLVVADIENPYFARAAHGIADAAHAAGYEVLLANADEDPATERAAVRTLIEKRVDGLIIAPASTLEVPHLIELKTHGVPVVQLDRAIEAIDADAVVVDNEHAAHANMGAESTLAWLVAVERMHALHNEASAQPAELMAGGAGGAGSGLGRTRVTRLGAR